MFTIRDPLCPVPIELGAEFVHGRPREIWDVIRSGRLTAYHCAERAIHLKDGKPRNDHDAWESVDRVMSDMQRSASQHEDQTFASFLAQSSHSEDSKRLAASYVEGFNAARKEVIGIASLAEDAKAADDIDGDRSFRILNGYDSVIGQLLDSIDEIGTKLRLNLVVEKVEWKRGSAAVHVRSALTHSVEKIRSRCVIITVPLGVLQMTHDSLGSIRFEPEPAEVLAALHALRFGQVVRLVLRFREAFWESNREISEAGFLLSDERLFPTWWTSLPIHAPVITGWSAGPHADELAGRTQSAVISEAISSLARITGCAREGLTGLLEAAYNHDWHADPFVRGAYSYVPAGALAARRVLAEPVADTLYFAGEATNLDGHSATVHGAIASGKRAARQCRS
ncbi:MAG: flavin monoamine oxidase family protein [Bryobacteraceae bacterium]